MTTTEQIPIFCADCNNTGSVGQVTASLRCRACGSANLGLVGVDARPSKVVAARQASPTGFTTEALSVVAYPHGPGTGWGKPMPDPLHGWNEYAGPTPQTFPRSAPVSDTSVCPVCKGSKYDLIDKGPCRECGGTGYIVHPTGRGPVQDYDATTQTSPPGGAGWHGATLNGGLTAEAVQRVGGRTSTDPFGSPEQHVRSTTPDYPGNDPARFTEQSPHLKTRQDHDYDAPSGPYQMDQASCPSCGHQPTELRKDKNENAWWHCPNCGPLANIDAHPEINPYSPPQGFSPDRNMKTGGFLSRNKKTGRLLTMLAAIHEANELDAAEAVDLALKTINRYSEGR